tara:strand:- start:41 stop:766 length:726 start_codon:yes stop_codon:yes gene_type:complete
MKEKRLGKQLPLSLVETVETLQFETIKEFKQYMERHFTPIYCIDMPKETPKIVDKFIKGTGRKYNEDSDVPFTRDLSGMILFPIRSHSPFTYFRGKVDIKEVKTKSYMEIKSIIVNYPFGNDDGSSKEEWYTFSKGLWDSKETSEKYKYYFKDISLTDVITELGINEPNSKWGGPKNWWWDRQLFYYEPEALYIMEEDSIRFTDVFDRDEVDVDDLEFWDAEAESRASKDPSDDPRLGKID